MIPESKVYVSLNELQNKVGATIEFTQSDINAFNDLIKRIEKIKADLKRMLPYTPKLDDRSWNSFFYKDVFTVKYGLDSVCQKRGSKLLRKIDYRNYYQRGYVGFEEKQDSFEAGAMGILQGIKDDTVREMLLKQMKALV